MYLQSLLPPHLQHQQPLQTVRHRLQSSSRKLLHSQASTCRHPRALVQADERQERPVGGYRGTRELREEMGADPRAAALEGVSGLEHRRLQVGEVGEEAAPYGGQLGAGFSQDGAHRLEPRRGVEGGVLLQLQLLQLHGLRASAVSLPANHTSSSR